jgi:hypothetical protein
LFPPRTLFQHFDTPFLVERSQKLTAYLNRLLSRTDIERTNILFHFLDIESKIKSSIKTSSSLYTLTNPTITTLASKVKPTSERKQYMNKPESDGINIATHNESQVTPLDSPDSGIQVTHEDASRLEDEWEMMETLNDGYTSEHEFGYESEELEEEIISKKKQIDTKSSLISDQLPSCISLEFISSSPSFAVNRAFFIDNDTMIIGAGDSSNLTKINLFVSKLFKKSDTATYE